MIQPLVQDLGIAIFVFSVLESGGQVKPRIRLDRNLVCELLLPSASGAYVMYVQSLGSIALSWFSNMATWWPYLKSDQAEIPIFPWENVFD
jgi:hypothetical protein